MLAVQGSLRGEIRAGWWLQHDFIKKMGLGI